ncbi:MAG: hypothetical protein ACRECH_10975 [Nitrososphaerales archaeon]
MDQEVIKEKSLELIHKTKEFLVLEKSYEESLSALLLIGKARASDTGKLPGKVLARFHNARNLDEAEEITMKRMSRLKAKMNELSSEIRELSDLLKPYFSGGKAVEPKNNAS